MSDYSKLITACCVLFAVFVGFISAKTDANRFEAQAYKFSNLYKETRISIYVKSVCGVDGSPITEKDKSCITGVQQRAKNEIEAMKQE